MANEVKTIFTGDVRPMDKAVDAHKRSLTALSRDVAKFERQREQGERDITALITRQAEQQYRAKVSAQKRATQDILAELKKQREANSGTSDFLTQVGGGLGGGIGSALATGGAIGAAVAVVLTAVSATKALASATFDLSKESVRLAGDYQLTTNALTVFTGSAATAKKELKDISEAARQTPGLALEAAEKGYLRLRGIGFEAERARRIVKELAEEATLSGANTEAVERVVFNFAQIASGGQKVGQEIREIITQIPSLNRVFREAFGTISGDALQDLVDANPDEFFDRLIGAMEKGRSVTGGFNDSLQKLSDEVTRAGRTLGEPILDPLTKDVRDLTKLIIENQDVLVSVGQSVADTYRTASFFVRTLADAMSAIPEPPGWLLRYIEMTQGSSGGYLGTAINLAGLGSQVYGQASNFGSLLRQKQDQGATLGASSSGDISGLLKQQEKADKDALESLKRSYDQRQSITENYYKIEEAKVAVSGKSEIEQIKAIAAIKRQAIQQQLREESENYSKVLALAKDREDIEKAGAESFRTRNKLETELRLSALEAERTINDERKKQAEERKREAEKAQKEAEQLRKSVTTLFDDVAGRAGTYNPYLKYLKDAEIFTRNLKEVTKGLTEEQRNYLIATEAATAARHRSELRGASIVEAFGLRAEARDFRRGYLLEGQAAIDQRNRDLQEQFSQLSRGKLTKEAYDKIVIDLTRGINPRELTNYNRFEAAQARERQAERIARQEKNADDFYTKMLGVLSDGGLQVKISQGTLLDIAIQDPTNATTATTATPQTTNLRYGNR